MCKTNLDLKKLLKKLAKQDFVQKLKSLVSFFLAEFNINTVFISICDESFCKVLLKTYIL